jgi:hypothetical protein
MYPVSAESWKNKGRLLCVKEALQISLSTGARTLDTMCVLDTRFTSQVGTGLADVAAAGQPHQRWQAQNWITVWRLVVS